MRTADIYLGFDPGGERSFGVASLRGSTVKSATVSSVADAIGWALNECGSSEPVAAGIDTMLHWCDAAGGWRPADKSLRATYPGARSSILSPNGLYGSMGIGGMALALRLRQLWPNIRLNETHPKVLAFALRGERHRDADPKAAVAWFAQHSGLELTPEATGHDFDAVLSAWATREGLSQGWTDLVSDDPALLFPTGRVSYLWPEALVQELPVVQTPKSKPSGPGPRRVNRHTTDIGHCNKNQQVVVRRTDLPGTDHGQRVYVLRCGVCSHEYGANGSDIFLRKCPKHDRGAPGLAF
jgi:membrane-associated phospholipid phosphatase